MEMQQNERNPLRQFMRQPKIYIKLPSQGKFWPQDSLIKTETGEYPVYSMTARDELLLKIPDALLNGQAVVDIIQNCMPNITNAWDIPSLDIDVILIAIRIATYGEKMKFPIKAINDIDFDYEVDLRVLLDQINNTITWDPIVPINDDLTIYVKPLPYKKMTASSIETFETQKILELANNEKLSEQDKIAAFKESFEKLTNVTLNLVNDSIYKIDSSHGSTENYEFINEFMNNLDKEIFNKIYNHLDNLRQINTLKPLVISVTEEMKAMGISDNTIEVPLVFDPANFFV